MGGLPISMLMFGTLVAALAIGIFLWLRFIRKPKSRHPMDGVRERNVGKALDEAHTEDPPSPR